MTWNQWDCSHHHSIVRPTIEKSDSKLWNISWNIIEWSPLFKSSLPGHLSSLVCHRSAGSKKCKSRLSCTWTPSSCKRPPRKCSLGWLCPCLVLWTAVELLLLLLLLLLLCSHYSCLPWQLGSWCPSHRHRARAGICCCKFDCCFHKLARRFDCTGDCILSSMW